MAKIKVELKVPDSKYCDNEDTTCPMCRMDFLGTWFCALFDTDLEVERSIDYYYCKRCDECKQTEVKE